MIQSFSALLELEHMWLCREQNDYYRSYLAIATSNISQQAWQENTERSSLTTENEFKFCGSVGPPGATGVLNDFLIDQGTLYAAEKTRVYRDIFSNSVILNWPHPSWSCRGIKSECETWKNMPARCHIEPRHCMHFNSTWCKVALTWDMIREIEREVTSWLFMR